MTVSRRRFLQTSVAGVALGATAGGLVLWPSAGLAATVSTTAPGLGADHLDQALWESLTVRQPLPISTAINVQVSMQVTDPLTVPVTVRVQHPMTADDYITAIYLFVDHNPHPLASIFHCSPLSGAAVFSERIKLYRDSSIQAIARDNHQQLLASAPVPVHIVGPLLP